ncbi:MAG: hypothetical protein JXX14_10575 [Deltaproteobacteria bacterium]|nr:hypothetical protein [Deltaproteobacteria bacterium]
MNRNRPLIICGNGAMAQTMFHVLERTHEVVAFTVEDEFVQQRELLGQELVPFSEITHRFTPSSYAMLIAIGFVKMNAVRQRLYTQAKSHGYQLISYVHHSVDLHNHIVIGENCIIMEHVAIHPGTTIGNNTFISSNANIGHDCRIGENCWINGGVSIAGGVVIENNCVVGVNASLGHKLILGEKTFVGAHTLVVRNTAPASVLLSPEGEKHRLSSDNFLKFSGVV